MMVLMNKEDEKYYFLNDMVNLEKKTSVILRNVEVSLFKDTIKNLY